MNLYREFLALLPQDVLLVGRVTSQNADGTSSVSFPDGTQMRPRGQSVPTGSKAFIQAGEIRGQAPELPSYDLEV